MRVAITGVGLVTPLGLSTPENVRRCLAGDSAIGPIHTLEVEGHRCRAGAYVPEFDLPGVLRFPKNCKFMEHGVQCAMLAAREALGGGSEVLERWDPVRIALYTGSGQTGLEYDEYFAALEAAWEGGREMDFKYLGGLPSRRIDRYIVLRTLSNGGAGLMSMELGIQGPTGNFVQSDTASAQALSCAYYDLLEDRCDAALAGGYDSLLNVSNYLAFEKADLLSALDSSEALRPFDRRRDGLVLGGGAGFFLLERWADAEVRNANIVGELCASVCSMDVGAAFETSKDPARLRAVVGEAVGGAEADFVVARGIGTRVGDSSEAAILAGTVGVQVPVTAFKSRTGYLGAATCAVEMGLGLMTAREGFIPPIVRHTETDSECKLDLVVGEPRLLKRRDPLGLFLSASWGGQIAAVAARTIEA